MRMSRGEVIFWFIWVFLFVWAISLIFPAHKVNSCDCGSICSPKHKTAGEPLSNKQLQSWYDGLNEEYFYNRLPRAAVTWGDLTLLGDMGITMREDKRFRIIIDRTTNPTRKTAEETVAHELCHVATWEIESTDHGQKFQTCMVNLADRGAFENIW
jgi:SprT-like family